MIRNIQVLLVAVAGIGFSGAAFADYECSTTVDGYRFTATHYSESIARRDVQEACMGRTHDFQACRQSTVCQMVSDHHYGENRYERELLATSDVREFIRMIQRRPLNGCMIGNGSASTFYRYYILRNGRSIDVGTNTPGEAVSRMKRAIRQGLCR